MNFNFHYSLVHSFPRWAHLELRLEVQSHQIALKGLVKTFWNDYCCENLRAISLVALPFSVCCEGEKSQCLTTRTAGSGAVTVRIKHGCSKLQMVRLCVRSWNGWTSMFFMEIEKLYQLPPSPYAVCIDGKRVHFEVKPIGTGRCFSELIYSVFLDWSLKNASSSPWEVWHLLRLLSFYCLKLKIFSILSALILMKRLWNLKFKLKLGMALEIYSLLKKIYHFSSIDFDLTIFSASLGFIFVFLANSTCFGFGMIKWCSVELQRYAAVPVHRQDAL